ncbi:MAG: sugar O-acetyltransferase precursor [Flavipsychrobacter sp.]|nr:sugar O-acetyltransferase precursor [Flavipsychrobacter sp.]
MRAPVGATNYQSYMRIGDSMGIHKISFHQWFLDMKSTSKEPLFIKSGIHWSVYGSVLAGDSLVRYIEKARNIRLPHPQWVKTDHVRTPREPDNDIQETANLLWPVTDDIYTYPILKYPEDSSQKPKVIFIGDSFGMNLLRNGLPQHTIDSDWQYWFSFQFIDNKDTPIGGGWQNPLIKDYNWLSALDKTDCIILMYTSINLCNGRCELGNGFIEQAYDHYFPAGKEKMAKK